MNHRTMAQRRAAHALERIKAAEARWDEDARDRYAGYVEKLVASILTNGLGQAAAFERAAGQEHLQLYRDLEDWLCGPDGPYYRPNRHPNYELMDAIVENDRHLYMRAQAEALAWLEWLKKFAVAYLKKPGGEKQ